MVLLLKRTTTQQVETVWSAPRPTWRAPRPPGTSCTIVSEPLGRLMSRTEHMCDVTIHGRHVGSGDSKGMLCWSQLLQRQSVFDDLFWIQPDNQMLKSKTLAYSQFLWSHAVIVLRFLFFQKCWLTVVLSTDVVMTKFELGTANWSGREKVWSLNQALTS